MSQFLYAFNPETYPVITRQKFDTLGLDSSQLDHAYRLALKEHAVANVEDYHNAIVEYLSTRIVFREIRRIIGLDLWKPEKPEGSLKTRSKLHKAIIALTRDIPAPAIEEPKPVMCPKCGTPMQLITITRPT